MEILFPYGQLRCNWIVEHRRLYDYRMIAAGPFTMKPAIDGSIRPLLK